MDEGGLLIRFAQSRGECPGSSITFFEERFEDGRVDAVDAADGGGAKERVGGLRRVEAADGGGCRVDDKVGGTWRELLPGCGEEDDSLLLVLGLSRGPGRAGGCIVAFDVSDTDDRRGPNSEVSILLVTLARTASMSSPPPLRAAMDVELP